MKQHEREFFVARIRSGITPISNSSHTVYVHTPNMLQNLEANRLAIKAYNQAEDEGLMCEEEMNEWMIDHGLWSEEEEEAMKGIEEDIKTLRKEIYINRDNDRMRETIRRYIRAAEKGYAKMASKKAEYSQNTCEGIAISAKYKFIIEKCCTDEHGNSYDFSDMSVDFVSLEYQSSTLSERQLREIAREEPWRSTWSVYGKAENLLFNNKDRELTQDQKSILVWSTMYDNIQEHLECPSEEVIKDDDVLDGWFIIQKEKREQEKLEAEMSGELTNDKIRNSHEVYMIADNDKRKQKIEKMNNSTAAMFKKQREALVESRGTAQQNEFFDEKIGIRAQQGQMFKNKFRK